MLRMRLRQQGRDRRCLLSCAFLLVLQGWRSSGPWRGLPRPTEPALARRVRWRQQGPLLRTRPSRTCRCWVCWPASSTATAGCGLAAPDPIHQSLVLWPASGLTVTGVGKPLTSDCQCASILEGSLSFSKSSCCAQEQALALSMVLELALRGHFAHAVPAVAVPAEVPPAKRAKQPAQAQGRPRKPAAKAAAPRAEVRPATHRCPFSKGAAFSAPAICFPGAH